MIGENQYNGFVDKFISGLIINEVWNNLGRDGAGTTPVTLGTDDWFIESVPAAVVQRPLYNRLGGGATADIGCYFYKNDRVYINDITLFCNFADGLVKQSNITIIPAIPPVTGDALPDYTIVNDLRIILSLYAMDVDPAVGPRAVHTGTWPISHFNNSLDLGYFFLPELVQANFVEQTDLAYWLEASIVFSGDPAYSTKNINTAFQTDRCQVWAELTLSHTFGVVDRDAVVGGTTGWPS